jgi:hypothetical protein
MNSISIITAKAEPYQIEYYIINSMHPRGINDAVYEELINASSAFLGTRDFIKELKIAVTVHAY